MKSFVTVLAVLLTSPLTAQVGTLEVRTWQFEGGGRMMISLTPLAVQGDLEMRIFSGTPAVNLTWSPLRLDARLAVYRDGDSIRVFGTVVTGRVTGHTSEREGMQLTVHESRVAVSLAAAQDEPIWLFPFGRPGTGERSLAFEILPAGTTPAPRPGQMPRTYVMDATNLRVVARPAARASVRLTAGDVAPAFEGMVQTLRPVTLGVHGREGRAGIRVVLQPEPWGDEGPSAIGPCLAWSWLDGSPPGGGVCLGDRREARQLLYGSGGVTLHVERLP